jgi:cell division protein FtsB
MSLNLKNILLVGFLIAEIVIFGVVYLFGSYGIRQLKIAKHEQKAFALEVEELKSHVLKLEKQLQDWEKDSFQKEKMARERLHLSRPNEQIYYLS